MRATLLTLTCAAVLAAPPALAQNAPGPDKIFASSPDIQGLIEKAKGYLDKIKEQREQLKKQ